MFIGQHKLLITARFLPPLRLLYLPVSWKMTEYMPHNIYDWVYSFNIFYCLGHPWCYHHCGMYPQPLCIVGVGDPGRMWCGLDLWFLSWPSEYSVSHWDLLPHSFCGGSHQSPVDIETHNVVMDKQLDAITFTGFDNKNAMNSITNTGHTGMKVFTIWAGKCWSVNIQFIRLILFTRPPVMCGLKEDTVEVSGGGLGFVYSTLQLHFHWDTAQHSGSEHTLDSKRYPMEVATITELLHCKALFSNSLFCCTVFQFLCPDAHREQEEGFNFGWGNAYS